MPAGGADEAVPGRIVALGRLRRENAGAGIGGTTAVGAVEEHRAGTGPPQLEGCRRSDDPPADDCRVEGPHEPGG
jgi:hypothetical protein